MSRGPSATAHLASDRPSGIRQASANPPGPRVPRPATAHQRPFPKAPTAAGAAHGPWGPEQGRITLVPPPALVVGRQPMATAKGALPSGAGPQRPFPKAAPAASANCGPGEDRARPAAAGAQPEDKQRPAAVGEKRPLAAANRDTSGEGAAPRPGARAHRTAKRQGHAAHFSYSWERGLLGADGTPTKFGPCSDPEALPAACKATLAAIPPVAGAAAMKLAEEGGYCLDEPLVRAAKTHRAVINLVRSLPVEAALETAGVQACDAATTDAGRVLGYILRKVQTQWSVSTIDGARRAWERYLLWLRDNGIDHTRGDASRLALSEYFLDCHNEAVTKTDKEWAEKLEKWATSCAQASAEGKASPEQPVRKRFGMKAALGQYDGLNFLRDHFCMHIQCSHMRHELPEFQGYVQKSMPLPAPPFPLWVIARLEDYAGAPDTPPALRNAAAATLFLVFACSRAKQAQNMQLYGEHDGCIWGHFELEKGKQKRPKAFWAALEGFRGRAWWDTLLQTLQGAEDGGFVFRAFSGAPDDKTADGLPAALADDLITQRIRLVLQRACGLSEAEALRYTKHSGRHCLTASSAARGEDFRRQVEVGGWSGGSADGSDILPEEFQRAKQAMKLAVMPIRYTQRLRPLRLAAIMRQQTQAFRTLLASLGGDIERLPRAEDGYKLLPRHDPATEGM